MISGKFAEGKNRGSSEFTQTLTEIKENDSTCQK